LLPVEHLTTVEDTVTAQAGAFAAGPGIVVIAGTGSIAYGKAAGGEIGRTGGWGYLMGDEGSGYDIGRQTLQAATQAVDGRGPATLLAEQVPAHLGLPSLEAVHEAVYAGRLTRAEIAGLARLTAWAAAAPQADRVARAIFERAGAALALTALAVARQLAWSDPPISPVGGVFKAGSAILDPFTRYLKDALPQAHVQAPRYPQVVGALLLALQAGGYPPDEALLQRLDGAVVELGLTD
jgi:N-acetylglucosamine kinase